MQLDYPTVPAVVRIKEDGCIGQGDDKYWVGSNEEWMAFVWDLDRWSLKNVYRTLELALPPVHRVGITPHDDAWLPTRPLIYRYKQAPMELLKIQIPSRPYLQDGEWHYDAIAVFDKLIAFLHWPRDRDWIILRNDFLRPSKYVDAVATGDWGRLPHRIYAVTETQGDVLVWEPYNWGTDAAPRVIPAPVIEDDDGGDAEDDESRCWFLAPMKRDAGPIQDLLWIHTRGARNSLGAPIAHMGTMLSSYPTLRCHVFSRSAHPLRDPVEEVWSRIDNLDGQCAFLGINYPFFLKAPARAEPSTASAADEELAHAAAADEELAHAAGGDAEEPAVAAVVDLEQALPLFKPDCVFATHPRARHLHPKPIPDWSRMNVNGGPSIGSTLEYREADYDNQVSAPLWFVPTVPPGPPSERAAWAAWRN